MIKVELFNPDGTTYVREVYKIIRKKREDGEYDFTVHWETLDGVRQSTEVERLWIGTYREKRKT